MNRDWSIIYICIIGGQLTLLHVLYIPSQAFGIFFEYFSIYNNGSLNPLYAPWLCQTCLEKEDGSIIAQCFEALRSSFWALGSSCKPWKASNLFLWQGLDVQKVTQKVLDGKHVFLALHGPRNGMNGVQRAHRILPMQTCSGQSEWCQQWIPRSSQPKLLGWWNKGKTEVQCLNNMIKLGCIRAEPTKLAF